MNIYDKNDKNDKNESNEKIPKENKGKVKDFFRKQGFYVALFVCIALIGLTALLAINWENEEKDMTPTDQSVQNIESEDLANATSPSPSPTPSSSDNADAQEDESTSTTPSFTLTKPVNGDIINPASTEKLVFNSTLNQWSTHNGVDIKGADGVEVLAAMSGTIETISQNDLFGYVITIKHDSNIQTVYAGAKPIDGLEEGAAVTAGQQIGTLTNPIFEKHLETHLHFEVLLNGEYLNPEKYFSK